MRCFNLHRSVSNERALDLRYSIGVATANSNVKQGPPLRGLAVEGRENPGLHPGLD